MSFDFEDGGFDQDVMNPHEFFNNLVSDFDRIEGVSGGWSEANWVYANNGIYGEVPLEGVTTKPIVIPTRWNPSTCQWDKNIQIDEGAKVEVMTAHKLYDRGACTTELYGGLWVEKEKWHYVEQVSEVASNSVE